MTALLALLIAAAPGLFLHLRGRPLLAQRQDPALPERYFAYRRTVGSAVAIAFALLAVFTRGQAAWAVPAMLLGAVAGGFRVRRTLFEESWGLVSYLAHVLRFTFATLGFWLTIALAPALIVNAAGWWRVAAAGWFVLLLAWSLCYNEVFLRAVNAQDLERRDLDARLDALEALARVTAPRRLQAGPAGGRWANAFALPSRKRGAVVFGRTLLEQLEPDELVAVHAHELAHLEHFDRPRLRLGFAVTLTAMGLACLAVPWLARAAAGWSTIVLWAWPCLVLFGLAVHAGRHKAHEAESDARAVALLGGDGDALIRALTRIHALSALPARWAADFERSATHPSLAARAQAIRAASGLAAAAGLTEPLLVRGTLGGQRIVLEADRLHLLEGVPAESAESPEAARAAAARARTLAYAQLSELRVHAAVSGPAKLVVRPRVGGELAKVPIRSEDVAALQLALDRIGAGVAPAAEADTHPLVVTLVMIAVAIASIAAGPTLAPMVAAVLALIRPAAPGLAAVAVTAAGAALLAGSPSETVPFGADAWLMGYSALVGLGLAAALLAVWDWRRVRAASRWEWVVYLGLAASSMLALLAWLSAALVEPAALRLHQAALARPSAVLLPLGLAAALLCAPRKRLRWTAVLPALLAALPLAARGQGLVDRLAPDPLRARAAPFARRSALATPRESVILEGWAQVLRVSPSGASYAWQAAAQDDHQGPTFHLGRFSDDGVFRGGQLTAWDLRFVDDARVLAVGQADGGLELRLVDTSSEAVGWRRALPPLSLAKLQIDARGERWRVTGLEPSGRAWTVLEGVVGAEDAEERHTPTQLSGLPTTLVTQTAQAALGVRPTSIVDGLASRLAGLPFEVYGSELWDLSGDQPRRILRSAFSADCAAAPPAESPRFVCVVWDGNVSQVWALEPPAWQGTPLGTLPARLLRPVVAGGRLAAPGLRGGGFVLDLEARTFDRLPDEPHAVAFDLSLQGDTLGMLTLSPQRSAFRLYQLAR